MLLLTWIGCITTPHIYTSINTRMLPTGIYTTLPQGCMYREEAIFYASSFSIEQIYRQAMLATGRETSIVQFKMDSEPVQVNREQCREEALSERCLAMNSATLYQASGVVVRWLCETPPHWDVEE